MSYIELIRSLVPVVRAAGEIELSYFRQNAQVMDKQDGSPVTEADQKAEQLIAAALADIAPDIPMVGEEAVAAGHVPDISGGRFFLVDPLDGTRAFITGSGEFTVNIGLVEAFRPVAGIIYAPVTGALYYAADGTAYVVRDGVEEKIFTRDIPPEGLTVTASVMHTDMARVDEYLAGQKVAEVLRSSSSSKFCLLAEGKADIYPRLGPTSEWDTAAGEAILQAAGGHVADLSGQPIRYGKVDKKFRNGDFVARGRH